MLGRLLQTAAGPFQTSTTKSHQTPLESIQEESHTRELLFPDVAALKAAQQFGGYVSTVRPPLPTPKEAGSYDNKGGLEDISQDDIRMIIAQDTCGRWQTPQILFDSKRDDSKNSPRADVDPMLKQSLSARGKSMTSPPQLSRRGHTPNSSIFSRPTPSSPTTPRSPETRSLFGQPRTLRQPTIDSFVDLESRDEREETDALLNCMFGAAGFRLHAGTKLHVMPRKIARSNNQGTRPTSSGGPRRRTPLSRSTSLADGDEGVSSGYDNRATSSKPSIMITRLFTVSLSENGGGCTHQRPAMSIDQRRIEDSEDLTARSIKQKKVPMYAVSIIIQLSDESGYKLRQGGYEAASTPTSSPRRLDSFLNLQDSRTTPVFDSALRSHANYVLGNWTMLNRNIEILEHTASHSLRHILQSVPPAPKIDPAPGKGTVKSKASRQQTQQLVYVGPDCLQDDKDVRRETEAATKLVVTALRIRKVVVGQDNWGAWREEARWVGRWAATKEQHSFFYHILTAFLGNHNVWLRSLQSSQYRRRNHSHQQSYSNENIDIRYRTVIVASDKMAARRFIFLLSQFFPSFMGHNPVQYSSSLGYSFPENPPSFSLGRERSLRRTINTKRKNSVNGQAGHNRSVSFSVVENDRDESNERVRHSNQRRGSETFSIRTAALNIPNQSTASRKASISTVLAESDAPVPHFSALEDSPRSNYSPRPGSGGSMASLALSQSLQRRESSTHSNGGRWGSMVSGFWGNRRGSVASDQDTAKSITISPQKSTLTTESPKKPNQLEQIVAETANRSPSKNSGSVSTPPTTFSSSTDDSPVKRQMPREIPGCREIYTKQRMPLNINYNEEDGFLDVNLSPGHSFQSSLASSLASFRLGTGSPCDHTSLISSFASDVSRQNAEVAIDVAGWLKNYHPNFTLQAVRPYDSLLEEIKQSMFAEASITPTPVEVDLQFGKWVDICVTLVADTTNFTIHKLRLCRRKKPGFSVDFSYEQRLIVEPVSDADSILMEAIERVLAVSGGSSRSHSRASSPKPPQSQSEKSVSGPRSVSRPPSIRGRTGINFTDARYMAADAPHYETRRTVLGALEEVVRSVREERDLGSDNNGVMSTSNGTSNATRKEANSLRDGVRKWLNGIDEL